VPAVPAAKVTPVAFVAPAPAEPSRFAPPPLPTKTPSALRTAAIPMAAVPPAPPAPQPWCQAPAAVTPRTEPLAFVAASAAVPLPSKPETKPSPPAAVVIPVVYNQPTIAGPSLRQAAAAPAPMPVQVMSAPVSPYGGAIALSRNQVPASKFATSPYAGAVAQVTPQAIRPVPLMPVAAPQPVAPAPLLAVVSAPTPAPMVVQPPAPPHTAVPSATVRHQIKQHVEAVCGKAARDVEVNVQPNNRLVVQMKVHSKEEGEQLGQRIMALPELAPYQVDLAMAVKP
jgi:hypothetical protein